MNVVRNLKCGCVLARKRGEVVNGYAHLLHHTKCGLVEGLLFTGVTPDALGRNGGTRGENQPRARRFQTWDDLAKVRFILRYGNFELSERDLHRAPWAST